MATVQQDSAEDIRRRMAEIRSQLHNEMSHVVGAASTAFDWRSHVRERPWLSLAAAFAAGYLVVPRRKCQTTPSDQAMPVAETPPAMLQAESKPDKSLAFQALRSAAGFLAPLALRVAQGVALREVDDFLGSRGLGPGPKSGADTGSSRQPVSRPGGDGLRNWNPRSGGMS